MTDPEAPSLPLPLRRTALFQTHLDLGAKVVDFGGWEMPLNYAEGTLVEHRRCRSDAVIFDVSHLGTVRVTGPGSFDYLQDQLTNDLRKISVGRAQYTHLVDPEDASVLDDIIVWWVDDETFDVMPNASSTETVRSAIGGVDVTSDRTVIAVQGPKARARLATVLPDAAEVPRFGVTSFEFAGLPGTVAGTGYTGEDGVELSVPNEVAVQLWHALIDAGLTPAGLGARDTLRLEAALPLFGHELGPGITPLQAKLGWVIGWNKVSFRGKEALESERERGPARLLMGIATEGRQPLRQGAELVLHERRVGEITSGNFSPMLEHGIGLALVDTSVPLGVGASLDVLQRGRRSAATIARLPFVQPGQFA